MTVEDSRRGFALMLGWLSVPEGFRVTSWRHPAGDGVLIHLVCPS